MFKIFDRYLLKNTVHGLLSEIKISLDQRCKGWSDVPQRHAHINEEHFTAATCFVAQFRTAQK